MLLENRNEKDCFIVIGFIRCPHFIFFAEGQGIEERKQFIVDVVHPLGEKKQKK